jgi:hypothetical protein
MPEAEQERLHAVWRRHDRIDLREGLVAYPRYHGTLQDLARHYGVPPPHVVAAFVALSPNNDYMGNLRSTVTLLEGRHAGAAVTACPVTTYNACRDRAWRFLHGEDFLGITKGFKTRSFYRNILDPLDPDPVTIDGHMINMVRGERQTMINVARSHRPSAYEHIAADVRAVAGEVGLIPCQLQAVLWFTWKRIHNIRFQPQLDLFTGDNVWGTIAAAGTIQPFALCT